MGKESDNSPKIYKLSTVSLNCVRLLGPHGLQPTRLLCSWNSPGKNTGVGSHSFLQGIFPTQTLNLRSSALQADSLLSESTLMSYKLNYKIYTLHVWLLLHNIHELHLFVVSSFLNCYIVLHCINILYVRVYLLIMQVVDIWVYYIFWLQ